MNFTTLLGLAAATFTTSAFLPQISKTWKSKSAKDVSLGMSLTFCIGLVMWLIYGIRVHNLPIILANLLSLICNLIIVTLKIRYSSPKSFVKKH
jgi:MtN3 and saliva related transmembrane protein